MPTILLCLDLFELLQSRRAAEVARPPTIEAQHIEVAPGRDEPLSFMTFQTVEGIVGNADFDTAQGQTTWESKVEKIINLGHAYSSVNTVTGEICYMVDSALYKDILLAVAARKQNEQILIAASERMGQHIEQIAGSNERIMQREKHAIEQMAQRMNESHLLIQDEHRTRMTNVMTDIRALRDSLTCSADHDGGSQEMQRLQFDMHRYENVISVYLARINDAEKANQRLLREQRESAASIEHLRDRLDRAERLVCSMGTPKSIKRKRAFREQDNNEKGSKRTSSSDNDAEESDGEDEDDRVSEQSSSSSSPSEDGNDEVETRRSADQVMETSIDLSMSPTDPDETSKGTDAAPANRLSFKEALEISGRNLSQDVAIGTLSGTDSVPAHRKLITLSSLGAK
jgi:hypothetical protein